MRSRRTLQQRMERRQGSFEPLSLLVGQQREPFGEPGRPPSAHALQQRAALRCQLEADPSPVVCRTNTAEQAGCLEPVDVTRERGSGDPLLLGKLPERQPVLRTNEPEEGDLVRRDAERLGLASQIPREAQERGSQLFCEPERRKRSLTNHS